MYGALTVAGVATVPDLARSYFTAQLAWELSKAYRPDREPMFRAATQAALRNYTNNFQRLEFGASPTDINTTNLQQIAYHSVNFFANLDPMRKVPVDDIYQASLWAINYLWNRTKWTFRRRQVTMTINTDSTVAFSGGETFYDFTTRMIYGITAPCTWASADQMAQNLASQATSPQNTGQPTSFRFQKSTGGSVLTWFFFPTPDQQYTAYTEITIAGPGTPASYTDVVPFAAFPAAFGPIIKDLVRAKLAVGIGIPQGEGMWQQSMDAIAGLLPTYDSVGDPASTDITTIDVYQDAFGQRGQNRFGGFLL